MVTNRKNNEWNEIEKIRLTETTKQNNLGLAAGIQSHQRQKPLCKWTWLLSINTKHWGSNCFNPIFSNLAGKKPTLFPRAAELPQFSRKPLSTTKSGVCVCVWACAQVAEVPTVHPRGPHGEPHTVHDHHLCQCCGKSWYQRYLSYLWKAEAQIGSVVCSEHRLTSASSQYCCIQL